MEALDGAVGALDAVSGSTGTTTPPASPPETGKSSAAAAGNTAPPASAAREAFDRLTKGEKPEAINAEIRDRAKGTKPAVTAQGKGAAQPATKDALPQGEKPGDTRNAWPDSLTGKDINVLKRGKIDSETFAALPATTQTRLLTNLRNSQAEADRTFQQAKKGKAGGTDAAAQADSDSPSDSEDEATLTAEQLAAEGDDAATDDEGETPPPPKQQGKAKAAPAPTSDVSSFVDEKDLETLRLLGGDELAETHTRSIGRVVDHFQGQQQALSGVLSFLLEDHIGRHFESAVGELNKAPGMDGLKPDHPEYAKNSEALKAKALILHRAAGDPKTYPFTEAVKDAAASLFRPNVHQAAQARLLASRRASLTGSAERGDSRRAEPRALDPKSRAKAIFSALQNGLTPNEARNSIDGA